MPFTIQLRADLVSPSMAAALRERRLPRGLDRRRERQPEDSRRDAQGNARRRDRASARTLLGAEGIRVGFFLMLGYLGEELDDILATRELVEHARPDDIGVSVAYPLPGTKFLRRS